MERLTRDLEALVLALHRRNGGQLSNLNWEWLLLEPALGFDSLDLAEIVVDIERRFQVSVFDAPEPPRTWLDVRRQLLARAQPSSSR